MRRIPSGTVTFVFTDIEGSTRLWEEHPEAMRRALEQHDALLRDLFTAYGGTVLKSTGDGTMAVFPQAPQAAAAVIAAQLRLAGDSWGVVGPLRVRMALHTGVAQERDGDYFGPTLNRAARLMAIAHGGQILASEASAALLRDSEDLVLLDLGHHRLRDLTHPERVFQLRVPGLNEEFPPLRTAGSARTNLPLPTSSFVGRETELARVGELLAEHRIVTITGVGGVGKTRLALQVAQEVAAARADGAWLCELAAATEAEGMADVAAAALGVTPRPGLSLEDSVVEFLKHKELLLILDNCEHLLDDVSRLASRIIAASPGTSVLATSREALAIAGEQNCPLRPLQLPAAGSSD